MAESATLGSIQYVINTTLGELGALSTLRKQLQDLQALAREGASFSVRIDPESLNGVHKAVAMAANRGYRQAAFDGTTDISVANGNGNVSMGGVVLELQRVVTALGKLSDGGGRRRPAAEAPAATDYESQSNAQRRSARERLGDVQYALGRGTKYTKDQFRVESKDDLVVEQLRAIQRAKLRGEDLEAKKRRELLKAYDQAAKANDTTATVRIREQMKELLQKLNAPLQERLDRLRKDIDIATRHATMAGVNADARSAPAGKSATATPGQGLVVDATAINAAMERAAETFAARLMAYVPDLPRREAGLQSVAANPAAGTVAAVEAAVATRAGISARRNAYGRVDRYGIRDLDHYELPKVECHACGGTGKYANGNTCWTCGGSKDENRPNRSAAISAGADPSRIGSAAYRDQHQDIVPSSAARQAANLKYYSRLSRQLSEGVHWEWTQDESGKRIKQKTERTRPLTEEEAISHREKMDALSYELLLGGRPAAYGMRHPDYHDGLLMAPWERKKMQEDPSYMPIPAAGPIDPSQHVAEQTFRTMKDDAEGLTAALQHLKSVDLAPVTASFREMAAAISEARKDINGFFRGTNAPGAVDGEVKLASTKAINTERERHARAIRDIRQEVSEERIAAETKRRADALIRARVAEDGIGVTDAGKDYDTGTMIKRLSSRYRRLDRVLQRGEELQANSQAAAALGVPTHESVQERLKNSAQYLGLRTRTLRDLQTAALNDPRRFGSLLTENLGQDPNNPYTLSSLLQDTDLHQRRLHAVDLLTAMQQQHAELTQKSVEDPRLVARANKLGNNIRTHLTMMETDLGLPIGMTNINAQYEQTQQAAEAARAAAEVTKRKQVLLENARTARTRLNFTTDENPGLIDRATSDLDEIARKRQAADKNVKRSETIFNRAQEAQAALERESQQQQGQYQGLFKDGIPKHLDVNAVKSVLAEHNGNIEETTKKILALGRARTEEAKTAETQGQHWDRLARKLKDIAAYVVAGGAIYSTINMARTALTETVKFEKDLADIQGIFVSKTVAERDAVKANIMDSSVRYGVNRSTVAGIAKTFAQTGANPQKTGELTNAALLASQGAGLNPDQATEMLIAVDNMTNGRVGPTDIIDRISRIEARYPVTAQDLSTVLQRVGPMAEHLQPNVRGSADSLDMLMGMSTSLISKTRMTGSQAGTALRFMLARLSSPSVQRKLQDQFGVMLGGSNPDEMRNMSDILGDIAGKYKGYMANGQSAKAAALLTTFAGARQANSAAALFDDWKSSMDIAKESSLAFGDSQRRLAIEMDTLEVKTQQAGNAFLNFAGVMIEKSGLLAGLKMGADAGTWAFGNGAKHPMLGMAGTFGAMYGVGKLLTALGKSDAIGAAGFGSEFFPMIGGALQLAGVASAGVAAYHATRRGVAYARGGMRGLFTGDYSPVEGAIWQSPSSMESDAETQRRSLYGPMEYDRGTYDNSEQGQAYKNLAGRFALSRGSFYATVSDAAEAANKDAIAKFGKNALTTSNDKLGPFIQEQFIRHLSETLPGFDQIKDKSEQAATALDALRKSAQYGGVSYFAEQGDFVEKSQQLGQQVIAALQSNTPTNAVIAALHDSEPAKNFHLMRTRPTGQVESQEYTTRGYGKSTKHTEAWVTPEDIGLAYTHDIGVLGGHKDLHARQVDVFQILQKMNSDFKLGDVLAKTFSTNHVSFFETVMDKIEKSGETLGQALDFLAANMKDMSQTELENLRVEQKKGQLNKAQLEDLRKGENFSKFSATIQGALGVLLDSSGRKAAGDAGRPAEDNLPTGGGAFAEMVKAAWARANKYEIQTFGADSERAKASQAFFDAHFNSKNWPTTKENIVGALNGEDSRAYLRDRVLDQLFRYGERESTIATSSKYLVGTGMIYDPGKEHAASAQELLRGLISVDAQLPYDRMKAALRTNLAKGHTAAILGMDVNELADAGVTEDGRNMITGRLAKARDELVKNGGLNTQQVDQLGANLKAIADAVKEWQNGDPAKVFDALGEKDQKTLSVLLGLGDNIKALGGFGATQRDAMLHLAQSLATTATADETQTTLDEQTRRGDAQRGQLRLRGKYSTTAQRLQTRLSMSELYGDQFGAFATHYAMLRGEHVAAVGMASQEQQDTLKEIWAKARDTIGGVKDGKLQGDYAIQAGAAADKFKTAVVEANLLAQQNLVQLLDDTHMEYLRKLEEHSQNMIKGLTQPITEILADPRKFLGKSKGMDLVTQIGQFGSQKIAASFMDNLVGPEGIFAGRLRNMFNSPMFMEADLIKRAHIDGITTGFRLIASGQGAAGLAVAQNSAAGSALSAGTAVAAGVAIPAYMQLGAHVSNLTAPGSGGVVPVVPVLPSVDALREELARTGMTSEQRKGYKRRASEAVYKNIIPFGYEGHLRQEKDAYAEYMGRDPLPDPGLLRRSDPRGTGNGITGTPDSHSQDANGLQGSLRKGHQVTMDNREDAWRFYLGLPQLADTFGISDYQPGVHGNDAKGRNTKAYYSLNNYWDERLRGASGDDHVAANEVKLILGAIAHAKSKGDKRFVENDHYKYVMGDYTLDNGKDEKGSYLAYYDKWDLAAEHSDVVGKPYEIYDRIYYDPKTFVPKWNTSSDAHNVHAKAATLKGTSLAQKFAAHSTSWSSGTMPPEVAFAGAADDKPFNYSGLFGPAPQLTLGGAGDATMDAAQPSPAQVQAQLDAYNKKARHEQQTVALAQAASMAAMYVGTSVFGRSGARGMDGKPNNYAAEGSQFGMTVGSLAGTFLPGGPMVWGPVGGLLGGLFGSRKKKPEDPVTPEYAALQKIERNTRESVDAITNQTRTLMAPENRLLYSPSTFALPQSRPFSSGTSSAAANGKMQVNITIDAAGRSGPDLADEIAQHLREQLATLGTFTDSRY